MKGARSPIEEQASQEVSIRFSASSASSVASMPFAAQFRSHRPLRSSVRPRAHICAGMLDVLVRSSVRSRNRGSCSVRCRAGGVRHSDREALDPTRRMLTGATTRAPADWRRGATCYEVFVRSFYDSDGDGIGDLRGLTQKLDYINDGEPRHRSGPRCALHVADARRRVAELSRLRRDGLLSGRSRVRHERGLQGVRRRGARARDRRARGHGAEPRVEPASVLSRCVRAAPAAAHRGWFRWSPSSRREGAVGAGRVASLVGAGSEYYYGVFWTRCRTSTTTRRRCAKRRRRSRRSG